MKPEDARKYADEVARMDNHFSETRIIVDVEVRDEIAATIRTLADRVHRLERDLLEAKHRFGSIVDSARNGEEDAKNTLKEGGAQ